MTRMATLLTLILLSGCVTAEQQFQADKKAYKDWLTGPYAAVCRTMPGPDSAHVCIRLIERLLLEADGIQLSRAEDYTVELAIYRNSDKLRQLWTVAENEAWLRGPNTAACNRAPSPSVVTNCLAEVQRSLDYLSLRGHAPHEDSPEVRAERAVARKEAQQRNQILESQRQQEMDAARAQAAGMILQGFAQRGGIVQPPPPQQYHLAPMAPLSPMPYQPALMPPVSCTSRNVGGTVYTDCY